MVDEYYSAQICLNGHVRNDTLDLDNAGEQNHAYPWCTQCGEKNIIVCTYCQATIHGRQAVIYPSGNDFSGYVQRRMPGSSSKRPAFCHNCGKPYPWTERALEAARELIDETEDYPDEDKEKLKQSLPDLVSDTPKTAVAVSRLKKWLPIAGQALGTALREVMVGVITDAAKKQLGI